MGCKEDCCIDPIPFWWIFNPILCYLSPKILIFQELLIIETWNKCHWIQHALNPKYAPLKPFQCIFPSQNQQNVKFLPEIVIFHGTTYCIDSKPKYHWIWHTSNPKYVPLKPFWCIFPSQNQQNVKFLPEIVMFSINHPCTRLEKNAIWIWKIVFQTLKCMPHHSHFDAFLPVKMHYVRTLCLTSTLWVINGFSWFLTGRL